MPRGRNRASEDGGRKPRQYVRNVPTHSFRLAVIDHFDAHGMPATLERFYPGIVGSAKDTKRKSVYLWAKSREKLVRLCAVQATSELRRSREIGTATTLPRDAELDLIKWINGYRAEGAPVSALMLKRKALQVASELGVSATAFMASWAWQQAFLRRHKLAFRTRTRQGQISPADASAKAAAFSSELQQRMAELGVDVVYNADQTPVFFEHIPTKTIAAKGTQTVWVRSGGKAKERVTCMLLGDSFGNKFEPFLILKTTIPVKKETAAENNAKRHGFGKRLWVKVRDLQSAFGVQIFANATAWWNTEMSVRFLEYHFGDRRGRQVSPILLLWDDFSAHWSDRVRQCAEELGVVLMRVPPGYTSVCQPADVSWNAPLKQRLRVRWAEMLHQQLDSHSNGSGAFKLVPPTRGDVVEWLADAWQVLSIATISNGFSPILKEEELSECVQTSYNNLASRLEEIHLLDSDVGTVSVANDVVDGILESCV